ncbi:CatB-related O-acetyltransferase [Gillisia sp. JM1]|uniref:CatB-related O-acetyltransferase n=1 Tax=Gillisia sp. JM1 TaxID=1283286 RepID=UPI00041CDC70|nr:CatB-related O-acetyltransferase [Gillisia sp. JM1]
MIKKSVKYILHRFKGYKIDFKSEVPLKLNVIENSKEYPVSIINSIVNKITLGHGCKLNNCICIGEIHLGRFVSIYGPGTVLSAILGKIEIGNYCSIGQNVSIQESYHNFQNVSSYLINKNIFHDQSLHDFITKGDIIIEDDVWIGSNSVILSGIKIGRGAIIGAGSVVTKSINSYEIWAGNPAKKIKMRFESDDIKRIEESQWWEWNISKLKKNKSFFMGQNS